MTSYVPQRIAVAHHPQLPEAARLANEVAGFLTERGAAAAFGSLYDELLRRRVVDGEFDLLIALGGDGTMLRAGHLCGPAQVPILGVNLGRFGFLIEVQEPQWPEMFTRLLAGDFWLERRMMLCAERWRTTGERLGSWEVLNEAVVGRGRSMRPVHLITQVDGRYLTTYVADALIAATPTGSTAYALACGGPILPPELRNILLVAVAPHLSIDRALVLAEGAQVSITLEADHQVVLSVDGQTPVDLEDGDRVDVRASDHTVEFVRFQDAGYFYRNLTRHMNRNPAAGSMNSSFSQAAMPPEDDEMISR